MEQGIIQGPGLIRPGPNKPGPFGNIQHDALGDPAKRINDDVPPTPGTRKHFAISAESQRLLINFEPVKSEHSVGALQFEEVSDKVSDKGGPKGSAKCPNSSRVSQTRAPLECAGRAQRR